MGDAIDIIVVGNGLFGSAAIRHLAERGHRVMGIGAPRHGPDVHEAPDAPWPSHRVYSSHNDAARLTRRQDRDPAWAAVTARAISNYRSLEERSGIRFFHDVGCLIVSRPGGDGRNPDPRVVMDDTGVDYTLHMPADLSWKTRWPELTFPETHYVAHEPSPAGYLKPKPLIAAQNKLAKSAGATFASDTVVGVTKAGAGYSVVTVGGATLEAKCVLIAAGGFSSFNKLVPSKLDITLKSEVIVLGEVTEEDARRLATYPTVKYLTDSDELDAIYMVAPVQYDDGRWYIKMGANTRLDANLAGLDDVQRWFATATDSAYLPLYEPALRALWPAIDFVSIRTQPCLITYTDNRLPLISEIGAGLYVATAGNGGGAKGSDAWGEQVANLIGDIE